MILIGQFDSSFVRRVGIALTVLELEFAHRPWSVFSDAERVRAFNPMVRVPVLLLGDEARPGAVLTDTFAILDYLDSLVPAQRRLTPEVQPERREALRIAALASQLADTAVSLFYEKALHATPSPMLVERRTRQLLGGIKALDQECSGRRSTYLFGDRLLNADIAVGAVMRHVAESHPVLSEEADHPALSEYCAMLEALPAFRDISQPFVPPA